MPEPFGFVVKNGTNRFDVSGRPLPSSSIVSSNQSPDRFQPIDDAAAGLERRVDGVAHDVDEQLLDLIRVGDDLDVGRRMDDRPAAASRARRSRLTSSGTFTGRGFGFGSRASCAYDRRNRPSAPDRSSISDESLLHFVAAAELGRRDRRCAAASGRST